VWRQEPTAVEAELIDRNLDVLDWHTGRMSSRRLLALLEHPRSTDSPYARAMRDGQWPEWMQMLKELHKESALYRASWYVGKKGEYRPQIFLDPVERKERFAEAQENAELQSEVEDELFGSIGWS
jgi:hypothetical protein